jgi:hypothetical protein
VGTETESGFHGRFVTDCQGSDDRTDESNRMVLPEDRRDGSALAQKSHGVSANRLSPQVPASLFGSVDLDSCDVIEKSVGDSFPLEERAKSTRLAPRVEDSGIDTENLEVKQAAFRVSKSRKKSKSKQTAPQVPSVPRALAIVEWTHEQEKNKLVAVHSKTIKGLERKLSQALEERAVLNENLRHTTTSLENEQERQRALKQSVSEMTKKVDGMRNFLNGLAKDIDRDRQVSMTFKNQIGDLTTELEALRSSYSGCQQDLKQSQTTLRLMKEEYATHNAEAFSALRKLQDEKSKVELDNKKLEITIQEQERLISGATESAMLMDRMGELENLLKLDTTEPVKQQISEMTVSIRSLESSLTLTKNLQMEIDQLRVSLSQSDSNLTSVTMARKLLVDQNNQLELFLASAKHSLAQVEREFKDSQSIRVEKLLKAHEEATASTTALESLGARLLKAEDCVRQLEKEKQLEAIKVSEFQCICLLLKQSRVLKRLRGWEKSLRRNMKRFCGQRRLISKMT